MAGRSRSSFGKRLKEMKRQEKRQDKAAKKDQRKEEKRSGAPGGEHDDLGHNADTMGPFANIGLDDLDSDEPGDDE